MLRDWESRVRGAIGDRAEIRHAPLKEALRHLRTAVPALEPVHAGDPDAVLRWATASPDVSEDLGTVFWEFMSLADAPDEEIARFAGRFGPLFWPVARREEADHQRSAPDVPQAADVMTDAPRETDFAEPLAAWRSYARGLRALYDLVDPAFPRAARDRGMKTGSLAVIAMPLWLEDPSRPAPPLTAAEFALLAVPMALDRIVAPPEWLVSSALALAGVGPAYPSAHEPASGLAYTVPARATVVAGRPLWLAQGLLPILTVSLAIAAQTQERARCTRCGKPAAILKRGPRKGRPWYGDHESCRQLARAETTIRAEDKRAQTRKRRTSDVGVDSSPVEPLASTKATSPLMVE